MTSVLVCESVRAATLADLVTARDAACHGELVELRLDGVSDPDPAGAVAGRSKPVVVTCRPVWEGGAFDGDEETRQRLLERALQAGAEFVDVEWQAPWRSAFVKRWGHRVVLSWHDFTGTPPDLDERAAEMSASEAAIVKIAVTTRRLRDLAPLLQLRHLLPAARRVVIIGMGQAGVPTRVLPHRFGSCWTYAGHGVAPGQIPAERLTREFRIRTSGVATAVFGVVGRPVSHSVSPAMHNAALAACGIDAVYVPFEASDFEDFLWAADALDVMGASVTAPFKADAFRAAARADARAARLEVANTLHRDGSGAWSARNTDMDGFLAPLIERAFGLAGKRVAVLGAGGAATAVLAALTSHGAAVTVYARRLEAAQQIAERFGAIAAPWPPGCETWDLLVNTTPVGTWPLDEASPLEASIVHSGTVYDLVYNPQETALLQGARTRGCPTIGGLEMLVGQAAEQFEWWTGQRAPLEVMRAAARRRLDEFRHERLRTAGER